VVMPQVQWEQHQPVKSSPWTQIKRLRIHLLPFACIWIGARRRRVEHIKSASPEGELLPVAEDYFPRNCERGKVTKVLRPLTADGQVADFGWLGHGFLARFGVSILRGWVPSSS
jgi:hypothetical protein